MGTRQANGLGLYDMTGNVWEWVEDWYADTRYASSLAAETGRSRVNRGGSWYSEEKQMRAANRSGDPPPSRYDILGLRLVLVPAR